MNRLQELSKKLVESARREAGRKASPQDRPAGTPTG